MRIIAGTRKGRTLKSKKGTETRPTLGVLREALFSILAARIPGSVFLDLFSGSGAMALEALSRGAARAVMIESDPEALSIIIENTNTLGFAESCRAYKNDVFRALSILGRKGEKFDLIFMDPPYTEELCKRVVENIARHKVLAPGGLIVCEHHKGEKLPSNIKNFHQTSEREYRNKVFTFYEEAADERENI